MPLPPVLNYQERDIIRRATKLAHEQKSVSGFVDVPGSFEPKGYDGLICRRLARLGYLQFLGISRLTRQAVYVVTDQGVALVTVAA